MSPQLRRRFLITGLSAALVTSTIGVGIGWGSLPAQAAQSDSICYVAGTGNYGKPPVDGPIGGPNAARFISPDLVAVGNDGKIYTIDSNGYDKLRVVDPVSQIVSTLDIFPDDVPGQSAQMEMFKLAFDRGRNTLYGAGSGLIWRWPVGAARATTIIGTHQSFGQPVNGAVARTSKIGQDQSGLAVDETTGDLYFGSLLLDARQSPLGGRQIFKLPNANVATSDATRVLTLVVGNGTYASPAAGVATASPLNGLGDLAVLTDRRLVYLAAGRIMAVSTAGVQEIWNDPDTSLLDSGDNQTLGTAANRSDFLLYNPVTDKVILYGPSVNKFRQFTPSAAAPRTVTLLAGNQQAGYVDGAGTTAQFATTGYSPNAAVAPDGSVVVGDIGNYRLRRISGTTGSVSTIAGVGPSINAGVPGPGTDVDLRSALGITHDPTTGDTYYSSIFNRVYKLSAAGQVTVFAGNGKRDSVQLGAQTGPATSLFMGRPTDLAFDKGSGALYVVTDDNGIFRVASDGSAQTWYYSDAGSAPGLVPTTALRSVAVGPDGSLYVTDYITRTIRKIPPAGGAPTVIIGGGTTRISDALSAPLSTDIGEPIGIAVDAFDNVYWAADNGVGRYDKTSNTVTRIAGTYDPTTAGYPASGQPNDSVARITRTNPQEISVDTVTGELFWVDSGAGVLKLTPLPVPLGATPDQRAESYRNALVRRFANDSPLNYVDNGNGGPTTAAGVFAPWDIASLGNGEAIFTDTVSNIAAGFAVEQIRILATNGCARVRLSNNLGDNPASGSRGVRLEDLPASALTGGLAVYGNSTLGNQSLNGTPIVTNPSGTPISSLPISSLPISSLPISSLPISSLPISSLPISSLPISSLPLLTPVGGWATVLAGTSLQGVPLQDLTLYQLLTTAGVKEKVASISFGVLDISSSPISSLNLASVALGATPISSLPLPGLSADAYTNWCTEIAKYGSTCAELGITAQSTVFELDVKSVPISSLPISSLPISSLPISSLPISSLPISSLPISSLPISSLPISSLDLSSAPISSLPISSLPISSLPISSLPVGSLPISSLFDCSKINCASNSTVTLKQAFDAGAMKPELTLFQLGSALNSFTLGQLAIGMPSSVTLGDFLMLLVRRADLPWEFVPFDKLNLPGTGAGIVTFNANFGISARRNPGPLTVDATMPAGFSYVDGSVTATITRTGQTPVALPATVSKAVSKVNFTFAAAQLTQDAQIAMTLQARPGVVVGDAKISWTVSPTHQNAVAVTADGALTVADPNEPSNNNADGAPSLNPDTLVTGSLPNSDVDYFSIAKGPKGTRTTIYLSHLTSDADMVLYNTGLTPPLRDGALRTGQTAPLSEGVSPALRTTGAPIDPQTAQDLGFTNVGAVVGIAAKRGLENETIEVISDGQPGSYRLQLRSYNSVGSTDPYLIRMKQIIPPSIANCIASPAPATGPGVQGVAPASVAGKSSLILVNRKRLGDVYGTAQVEGANGVMARLDALATATNGVVLPVDANPAVRDAYSGWDGALCDSDASNRVVLQINNYVDSQFPPGSAARAGLKVVTIVGGDDQIPMGRVPDDTSYSNEKDYAADLLAADGKSTPLSAAAAGRLTLTDDPYASFTPRLYGQRTLFSPDVAIGRLVETPADIVKSVNTFLTPGSGLTVGKIDPQSSFVSGYDFLADGAAAVSANLQPRTPSQRQLLTPDWDRNALNDELFPTAASGRVSPSIAAINAHFSHNEALPAAGNTSGDFSDLFTTADVALVNNANKLAQRILLSIGCHSGASVPDVYVGASTRKLDWPQAFAQQGATYVANTGFGYGDTDIVGYSEKLQRELAKLLRDGITVADALRLAKQSYLADGLTDVYDPKVLMQTTYYGIPNYTLTGTYVPPTPPTVPSIGTDPSTGLVASQFDVSPVHTQLAGPYYVADGRDPLVSDGRPVQPRTYVDVTQSGRVAHGALITALSSADVANYQVKFIRPRVDLAAYEPVQVPLQTAWPSYLQNVVSFTGQDASGASLDRQRVVLATGQWFSTSATNPKTGTQRLYSNIKGKVFYGSAADTDFRAPSISEAKATPGTNSLSFSVRANDPSGIKRVVALYLDGGVWRSIDLPLVGDAYVGATATTTTTVDYFVQVVDAFGNVAVSSNKATLFNATPTGTGTPTVVTEPPVVPLPNVAPVLTASGSVSGPSVTLNGSFADSDSTSWTATVDWGDGAVTPLTLLANKTFTVTKTFTSPGTYNRTATIAVTDNQGGRGTVQVDYSVIVTAANVAPAIGTVTSSLASTGASTTVTVNGGFTDPDSTSWTGTIQWGAGATPVPLTISGLTFTATKAFAVPGSVSATIKLTDNQGASSETTITFVVPNPNVAPVVTAASAVTTVTGGLVTIKVNGSFTDADSTSWVGSVNWGDGTVPAPLSVNSAAKTYIGQTTSFTNGTRTGAVTICDNSNACASKTFTYTVTAPPRQKVIPYLDCIVVTQNTLEARFGYNNPNPYPVTIPIGVLNTFIPGAANRGQPTVFSSGRSTRVFSVVFNATNLGIWTLDGRLIQVSKNFNRC